MHSILTLWDSVQDDNYMWYAHRARPARQHLQRLAGLDASLSSARVRARYEALR